MKLDRDDLYGNEIQTLKKNLLGSLDTFGKETIINNDEFNENLTADEFLDRGNCIVYDSEKDVRFKIFRKIIEIPSLKIWNTFSDALHDIDSLEDAICLSFFHGGHLDVYSDSWLVPLLNAYLSLDVRIPLYIVWMGVFVDPDNEFAPEYARDWYLEATAWNDTNFYKFLEKPKLNIASHSTIKCPFDNSTFRDLYIGGTAEQLGRSLAGMFGDSALWVGKNTENPDVCYQGISAENPVNANNQGIQVEYRINQPQSERIRPEMIAEGVKKFLCNFMAL